MKHVLLNIYQIIHIYENKMLCLLFCVLYQLFTSRLRHGHREANVLVVVVLVGTFYSQIFLVPVNYLDHPIHLNQPNHLNHPNHQI